MEIAACDAYRPGWHRWTTFGLERTVAFETDSLASTRPVESRGSVPTDEGMFDVLTYQKGGALLRMLEQYLGVERFRAGVSHYLRTHAYGNTETGDLWDAIEETSGEPVRELMDSWIWQPGYPLVSATLDGTDLVLTQQRFAFGESEDTTTWLIPVHVRSGDTTTRSCSTARRCRCRSPTPPRRRGRQRRRTRVLPRRLRGRAANPAGDVLASLDTLERYNLVDDTWNAVVAGRSALDSNSCDSSRGSPTSATPRCGRSSSSPSAGSGGARRRRLPALPAARSALS